MANYLSREKQVQAISLLCEGMSIRSVSRVTGIHQYTIGKLLLRVGEHCQQLLDEHVRDISVQALEVDEVWTFCRKKERRCFPGIPKNGAISMFSPPLTR